MEDEQRAEDAAGAGSSKDILMYFAGPDRGIIPGLVSDFHIILHVKK